MPIISEDNIIQIKLKMVIWIAGIIIVVFSTLFGWQEVQITNMKADVKELEKEKVDDNKTKIYYIKSEDLPQVLRILSVQQSQLNTLNILTFGKPIEIDLGEGISTSPTIPIRSDNE